MDLFTIKINNENYTYLDSVHLDNKKYVVYMDEENLYVSECVKKKELFFQDVSDEIYSKVLESISL